jgi:hypothetical protein
VTILAKSDKIVTDFIETQNKSERYQVIKHQIAGIRIFIHKFLQTNYLTKQNASQTSKSPKQHESFTIYYEDFSIGE